jgi:2-(1,2-epoxy-1,2-dihydrophenyl)acetyl-CoA isomerase
LEESDDQVLAGFERGVFTITLNSPRVRNALTPGIEAGLRIGLKRAEQSDVRAVVLTGRGPAFCAGANMKELDSNDDRDEASLRLRAREIPESILLPLARLEKPVIVALNGPAVGAGIGLALVADYRVWSSSASMVFAFLRLGLVPDLGIAWSLPRLIGHRLSRDLLLDGRTVAAEEALSLGLADNVVDPDELQATAETFARELAQRPTMAWGATKRLLARGGDSSLERFLDEEVLVQSGLVRTEDHAEGVRAHLERRSPEFRGR